MPENNLNNKLKVENIALDDHKKINNIKVKIINQTESKEKETNGKLPKWKKDSEQFRAAMKRAKDPDAVVVEIDDRIQCNFCKRKFAELTYEKHVNVCKNKNQQIKMK